MTRSGALVCVVAALLWLAAEVAMAGADADSFGDVAISKPVEALTFAKVGGGVMLVTEYSAGRVTGLNLTCALGRPIADPIEVFLAEGYRRLRAEVATMNPDCRIVSGVGDLTLPVDLLDHHIAAVANFPEHAGEAEVKDGPFLFAKRVEPTAYHAPIAVADALLDYEVELAWVPLQPLRRGEAPEWLGMILCNDYTDRATLLRHIDPWDIASAVGFTTGKSAPGYLPVGNLFVIPADYRAFAEKLELRLLVNGDERQRSRVPEAVWGIDELVEQTWQWQDRRWDHRGEQVSLLSEADVIPARTLIIGGTPSGTAFQGIPRRRQLAGAAAWLLGGWNKPMAQHVMDSYIETARAEKRFLQPGDRVVVHVDRMGVIDNLITAGP